jgi:uncharacterized membrane-anchored protein
MSKRGLFFLLAVLVQAAIIVAVPARQIHARMTGKLITIKTAPVDPYSFLSGYHVILGFEISTPPKSQEPRTQTQWQTPVFVVLKEGPDKVWQIDSVHKEWPKNVPSDQVVIRGKSDEFRILYGIEHFYIPETDRLQIDREFRSNRTESYAQVKVDRFGNAALVGLKIKDKLYEY